MARCIAAVFVAATVSVWAPLAMAACQVKIQAEMPVHMEHLQPLLKGAINGHEVEILADTGSNNSLMFRPALKRLGMQALVVDNTSFIGIDGVERAYTTNADTISIGSLKTQNLSLYVVGPFSGQEGSTVGLLGNDFFSQSDVEFDLAHNVIRFLKAEGCKDDEILYWGGAYSMLPLVGTRGHADIVQVKLNGRSVEAQLDTGASNSLISASVVEWVGAEPIKTDDRGAYVSGLVGRRIPTAPVRLKSVELDQESLKNVEVLGADVAVQGDVPLGSRIGYKFNGDIGMLLGADFFLAHRVLVSNRQHRVYFTYNGGPIFQTRDPEKDAK
jgi:predicted aspartyl protease